MDDAGAGAVGKVLGPMPVGQQGYIAPNNTMHGQKAPIGNCTPSPLRQETSESVNQGSMSPLEAQSNGHSKVASATSAIGNGFLLPPAASQVGILVHESIIDSLTRDACG